MSKVQLLVTLLLLAIAIAIGQDEVTTTPQLREAGLNDETTANAEDTTAASAAEPADAEASTVTAADATTKSDTEAKPDVNVEPDADATLEAASTANGTATEATSDADGSAAGNETTTSTDQLVANSTMIKAADEATWEENGGDPSVPPNWHKHGAVHIHAHDGFHNIKKEKLWAHWNDAFTTTVGIEPISDTNKDTL